VLVNPQNPVDGLTMAQVRDIFSGGVRNWSQIKPAGGVPALSLPVHPIGRFHCSLRPGHWRLILDGQDRFGTGVFSVGAIPDMVALVARDRAAIGWEVLGMVEKYRDKGKVKPIKVDGFLPSDTGALASLKYPVYRTYNITTWEGEGVENPLARELVEYLMRESEKLDLQKFGFAPASDLRRTGWKFKGNELVGEPR
jgi:ABC-type phosphate transport system substrate-binding protein